MRVLVAGASGIVGRFVTAHLTAHGHAVFAGRRTVPDAGPVSGQVETVHLTLDPQIDQTAAFRGIDAVVHAAFSHVPGRYRGGEGDDPDGFRRANLDGSVALFDAARRAGVSRCIFLSSRAVYGRQPAGAVLTEDMDPAPESLYGQVKREAEQALAAMGSETFMTASLRSTGIYGLMPGRAHKWEGLARAYLAGAPVEDRVGTELHGTDLASAVATLLSTDPALVGNRVFNASDLLTSHRDVLAQLQQATGCRHPLPPASDRDGFHVMDTTRLGSLGWTPGGWDRFRADIAGLAKRVTADGSGAR